jgi:hypothetical protein
MRKSLHEIQEIDDYLLHNMSPENRLIFGTRILLDPELKEKIRLQRKTISFLRWCARQQEKVTLSAIHQRLMEDASFKKTITNIFS